MKVSLCIIWSFTQKEQGIPFLSVSGTRLRDITVLYLLCVTIDALVNEGLSSMKVLWEVVRNLQPRSRAVRVALTIPLTLQNLLDWEMGSDVCSWGKPLAPCPTPECPSVAGALTLIKTRASNMAATGSFMPFFLHILCPTVAIVIYALWLGADHHVSTWVQWLQSCTPFGQTSERGGILQSTEPREASGPWQYMTTPSIQPGYRWGPCQRSHLSQSSQSSVSVMGTSPLRVGCHLRKLPGI